MPATPVDSSPPPPSGSATLPPWATNLSKRARHAILASGITDFEEEFAWDRLRLVHGCGRSTARAVAEARDKHLGVKLGGYERGGPRFNFEPTLTTMEAADLLGVSPDEFVELAEKFLVNSKPRKNGRIWSEEAVETLRKRRAGIIPPWLRDLMQRTPRP